MSDKEITKQSALIDHLLSGIYVSVHIYSVIYVYMNYILYIYIISYSKLYYTHKIFFL